MRDIKFRAWNGKAMEYGGFCIHATGSMIKDSVLGDVYSQSPVMQFTGLQDVNGVDIYEGDVIYLAGYGNYDVEFPFIELYEAGVENDIGEIKGNIYENPELLMDGE